MIFELFKVACLAYAPSPVNLKPDLVIPRAALFDRRSTLISNTKEICILIGELSNLFDRSILVKTDEVSKILNNRGASEVILPNNSSLDSDLRSPGVAKQLKKVSESATVVKEESSYSRSHAKQSKVADSITNL